MRAIAAHVLPPVGERTTRHVLETYTAQVHRTTVSVTELHGREIRGVRLARLPGV